MASGERMAEQPTVVELRGKPIGACPPIGAVYGGEEATVPISVLEGEPVARAGESLGQSCRPFGSSASGSIAGAAKPNAMGHMRGAGTTRGEGQPCEES